MPTSCRSCRQRIRWLLTDRGERIPVDPVRRPGGHYRVADDGRVSVMAPSDEPGFVPHYLTCKRSYMAARRKKGE